MNVFNEKNAFLQTTKTFHLTKQKQRIHLYIVKHMTMLKEYTQVERRGTALEQSQTNGAKQPNEQISSGLYSIKCCQTSHLLSNPLK